MSSNGASSTTGYDSSREDTGPLDLLQVSGLEPTRTPVSSGITRNCPACGLYLSAVVEEIVQLRERVNNSIKQSYYCRELQNACDMAERECRRLRKEVKATAEYAQELMHKRKALECELEKLHLNCKRIEIQKEAEVSVLAMKLSNSTKQVEKNIQFIRETEARTIALKEDAARWKQKADVSQERLQERKKSLMKTREECRRLRNVLAKAFCKSRLTATELDKVIVQQIPNDQEHIQTWVDFLNPLEMPQSMLSLEEMSPCDAKANVCHVLLAWLEGKGSKGKPRTWGTLLDAMRRGNQYLQELANRAEYILLEELASLRMDFHVCVICRRKIDPSEKTAGAGGDEWVEDGSYVL